MYKDAEETAGPVEVGITDNSAAGKKIFSLNFILLLQGSLVSEIGNNIHSMAMAFWLLQKTGSTAVMGIVSSVGMLVHSFVCLFSGAVIDKNNKARVLVWADSTQGLLYIILGVAALFNLLDIWMVVVISALGGIGSAFFFPASQSIIPEIISEKKLMKANAFMLMIILTAPIIGNSTGGLLLRRFGAPLLFIINGISFLISAVSEAFIRLPANGKSDTKVNILNDIKEGYTYLINQKGLSFFLLANMLINLFAFTGLFLILPFFERAPELGPLNFGIAMASLAAGGLAGTIVSTLLNIRPKMRFGVFIFAVMGTTILPALIPFCPIMPILLLLAFSAGFARSFFYLMFNIVIQFNVDQAKRGRIFGLIGIILHTTVPLGMIIGGVLAEFLPLKLLISGCFFISCLSVLPILFYMPARRIFLNE